MYIFSRKNASWGRENHIPSNRKPVSIANTLIKNGFKRKSQKWSFDKSIGDQIMKKMSDGFQRWKLPTRSKL